MHNRLDDIKRRLGYLARDSVETGSLEKEQSQGSGRPSPGSDWVKVGDYVYSREGIVPLPGAERLDLSVLGLETSAENLIFFDTETTGLSGGAGNLVFLLGLAWPIAQGLAYEQVFLSDFPGEPEFLERIGRHFADQRLYVSYNGRAFDSHLLITRHLMNGLHLEMPRQLDLLYLARRFWRRVLPECSLTTVERRVLGLERVEDIPGAEVPDAYFSYARGEGLGQLPLVFEHNRQDVITLARLLLQIVDVLKGRVSEPIDLTALGEFLLLRGDRKGLDYLREGFEKGDARAGQILSLHHKRDRQWAEAVLIWEQMAGRGNGWATIELAKYCEHRLRRPEQALQWIEATWRDLPVPERFLSDIRKRKSRLIRKIGDRREIRL